MQMKPQENLGFIVECNNAKPMGDTNILDYSADELKMVKAKFINFDKCESLEHIFSFLIAMNSLGMHLVSSDGIKVFHSRKMAEVVGEIINHVNENDPYPVPSQMLFYHITCLTRTCNLRYKVIEFLQEMGYE